MRVSSIGVSSIGVSIRSRIQFQQESGSVNRGAGRSIKRENIEYRKKAEGNINEGLKSELSTPELETLELETPELKRMREVRKREEAEFKKLVNSPQRYDIHRDSVHK